MRDASAAERLEGVLHLFDCFDRLWRIRLYRCETLRVRADQVARLTSDVSRQPLQSGHEVIPARRYLLGGRVPLIEQALVLRVKIVEARALTSASPVSIRT